MPFIVKLEMRDSQIKILSFGIIKNDEENGTHRYVIFEDVNNKKRVEMLVSKQQRPTLWQDIEKLERNENVSPYSGCITRINGVEIVVFRDEKPEQAFSEQLKHKTNATNISLKKANQLREESAGYQTDLTDDNLLEIAWRKIDEKTKKIKFRYYQGSGNFIWSDWYEIEQSEK